MNHKLNDLRSWVIDKYQDAVVQGRVPATLSAAHPVRVAVDADTEDQYVVALLHDIVEDGVIALEWPGGLQDLLFLEGQVYPLLRRQYDAIVLMTRQKENQTYSEYIDSIIESGNRLAMEVKVLDLLDHLRPRSFFKPKSVSHRKRYIKALAKLSEALGA